MWHKTINLKKIFAIFKTSPPFSFQDPLNLQNAVAYIQADKIEELHVKITPHMNAIMVKNITISTSKTMGYYWIGLILERFINNLENHKDIFFLATQCEKALRKAISLSPLYVDAHRALARNLWMQGRFKESLAQFQLAEEQRHQIIGLFNLSINPPVLLPTNCGHVIGLMGHIDAFIKRKILLDDKSTYHLVVPKSEVVNEVFLNYWSSYIHLSFPSVEHIEPEAMTHACTVDWNWAIPETKHKTLHTHTAMARVHRQWDHFNREPLLTLTLEHTELLNAYKATLGMQANDWFVCLHVRSGEFYQEKKSNIQNFRNTTLDDYHLTIKTIVDAGGWVFRMGDATTPKLVLNSDSMDTSRIIDYAHSKECSKELDVALSATCTLFISSPSGLHTVAHAFGRPVCYVNYPIYAGFPWHPNEVFTPQLYYSHKKKRVLSIEEILSSDLVHADHGHLLLKKQITLIPNTPQEIAETVLEALHKKKYRLENDTHAVILRDHFEHLNKMFNRDISGNLGLFFAQQHSSTLFPNFR